MLLNSLAVKTLWKMSLRIALIILLVTAASYFHLSRSIETQTKETILRYTKEREARERISFDLARQNHSTLASEFLREYRGLLKDPKLESRYQSLVRKYSDGVLRNKDTDSGPGISAKLQKKIFLPFFTTKRLGHGGGVGLSISAGIIKSHGGRLGIDNSSANTCFVISLPKSDTRPMA